MGHSHSNTAHSSTSSLPSSSASNSSPIITKTTTATTITTTTATTTTTITTTTTTATTTTTISTTTTSPTPPPPTVHHSHFMLQHSSSSFSSSSSSSLSSALSSSSSSLMLLRSVQASCEGEKGRCGMYKLLRPLDLLFIVFTFVPLDDIFRFRATCRSFFVGVTHSSTQSDAFFKLIYQPPCLTHAHLQPSSISCTTINTSITSSITSASLRRRRGLLSWPLHDIHDRAGFDNQISSPFSSSSADSSTTTTTTTTTATSLSSSSTSSSSSSSSSCSESRWSRESDWFIPIIDNSPCQHAVLMQFYHLQQIQLNHPTRATLPHLLAPPPSLSYSSASSSSSPSLSSSLSCVKTWSACSVRSALAYFPSYVPLQYQHALTPTHFCEGAKQAASQLYARTATTLPSFAPPPSSSSSSYSPSSPSSSSSSSSHLSCSCPIPLSVSLPPSHTCCYYHRVSVRRQWSMEQLARVFLQRTKYESQLATLSHLQLTEKDEARKVYQQAETLVQRTLKGLYGGLWSVLLTVNFTRLQALVCIPSRFLSSLLEWMTSWFDGILRWLCWLIIYVLTYITLFASLLIFLVLLLCVLFTLYPCFVTTVQATCDYLCRRHHHRHSSLYDDDDAGDGDEDEGEQEEDIFQEVKKWFVVEHHRRARDRTLLRINRHYEPQLRDARSKLEQVRAREQRLLRRDDDGTTSNTSSARSSSTNCIVF